MRVPQDQLDALNLDKLSLCYEIHGKSEQWFNLVTDDCVSVNTRYAMLSPRLNIMDAIAVRAVDEVNQCVNIRVDVAECTATVGSNSFNMISKYESNGIMVKRYRNRVRISVPNCQDLTLLMWVICENRTLENPDSPGSMLTRKMIKFVVLRGLNFGRRQAHGLLGQCSLFVCFLSVKYVYIHVLTSDSMLEVEIDCYYNFRTILEYSCQHCSLHWLAVQW